MASKTVPQPQSTSLILVTPLGTETRALSMDKTDFKRLILFRRNVLLTPKEPPVTGFAAERIKALLKSPKFTPQAVTELSKVIAAEEQRRKDAEAARTELLAQIEAVISEFQKEHKDEALLVWQGYLTELEQGIPQVEAFEAEMKMTQVRIDALKA